MTSGFPSAAGPDPSRASGRRVAGALATDVLLVLAFVLIGRRSHDSTGGLTGFAETAVPFLAGAVIGWLICRAWVRPLSLLPTGVTVWAATVLGGLAIRVAWGGGFALTFALVTTIVLAVLLIGWRLLVMLVSRRGWFGSDRRPQRSGR